MKKLISAILALTMMMTLVACGSKSEPAPETDAPAVEGTDEYPAMTIRLAHDAPLTTPHHEAAENIKAALEERSGGKIP